jgi:site-specific DNA-methyltransferase (adenine-specific)
MLYFQNDFITLYHGNCLEELAWLDADVLVTDPPYGAKWTGTRTGNATATSKILVLNDESVDVRDSALNLWDSEKPSLVFGKWSEPKPEGTKAILYWEKGNHTGVGDLSLPWKPTTEEIYVSGKWPPRPALGRNGGGRISNVIRVMATAKLSEEQGRLHPTEKPVELMGGLIDRCPPGVIADPFAGAGSTLVAAYYSGRKAIGVEMEEKYCEIIAKRLSQEVFDF